MGGWMGGSGKVGGQADAVIGKIVQIMKTPSLLEGKRSKAGIDARPSYALLPKTA